MNRLTWSERHHNALCKLWKRAMQSENINDRDLMRRIETACDWLHVRSLRKVNRQRRRDESRRAKEAA